MIAGITANMRGVTEQREAVSNVKTGITMMSYATGKYYTALDYVFEELLITLLDNTKKAFPYGFEGSYYKGADKVSFNALPSHYTASQFIVSIKRDDTDVIELQRIKSMANELAGNGLVKPKNMLLAENSKSKQEVTKIIIDGIDLQEKENNKLEQASQQIEQMGGQMEQMKDQMDAQMKEIENYKKQNIELEQRKLNIEEKEVLGKLKNDREKNEFTKELEEEKLEEIKERTRLEREQMYYTNGPSQEIKNID
jgi:ribosomal protein L15